MDQAIVVERKAFRLFLKQKIRKQEWVTSSEKINPRKLKVVPFRTNNNESLIYFSLWHLPQTEKLA